MLRELSWMILAHTLICLGVYKGIEWNGMIIKGKEWNGME